MTAKEKLRGRAGRRELHLSLVMRLSECMIRFLLAAALAGAEIFEGHALFGLAMVGVTGAGLEGFVTLLGAALGYLSFRGFLGGLRYIAAAMMVYAVALAMGEFNIYRRVWFMPAVAAALNGFLYRDIHPIIRIVLAAGGICMMIPGLLTDVIGLVILCAVILYQKFGSKLTRKSA